MYQRTGMFWRAPVIRETPSTWRRTRRGELRCDTSGALWSRPTAPLPGALGDVGVSNLDCRSYCEAAGAWPPVLDCRAEMRHPYELSCSWPLVMDFFDHPW